MNDSPEKEKRKRSALEARNAEKRQLVLTALMVLGLGLAATAAFVLVAPAAPTPQAAVVANEASASGPPDEAPLAVSADDPCNPIIKSGVDPDMASAIASLLDTAGIGYGDVTVQTQEEKETCYSEASQVYYDRDTRVNAYSPWVTLEAAEDDFGRGMQIADLVNALAEFDLPRPGDLIITFYGGESDVRWQWPYQQIQQEVANDTAPDVLYSLGLQ